MTQIDSNSVCQGPNQAATLEELKRENEELRIQLRHLMDVVSDNERIWRHFTEIERILFRTRQLDVLVEELLREVKARFQPDILILFLSHAEILEHFFPELSRKSEQPAANTWIITVPPDAGCMVCNESCKPSFLGDADFRELLKFAPDEAAASILSGVCLPLCIHDVIFGGLFLGSEDRQRYRPDAGTDLLEQLGVKIALCMENCLIFERVKDLTVQDPLTGLLNFFQINAVLEKEFRKAVRQQTPLSTLLIDLNFFHEANGQPALINEVLQHVAEILRETIPGDEGYLGRYGSDEFLVVLPNVPEEEALEVMPYLAQTIRKAPFMHHNTAILIQANIGVGAFNEQTRRPQDLLDAASQELCRQRMAGGKTRENSAADC